MCCNVYILVRVRHIFSPIEQTISESSSVSATEFVVCVLPGFMHLNLLLVFHFRDFRLYIRSGTVNFWWIPFSVDAKIGVLSFLFINCFGTREGTLIQRFCGIITLSFGGKVE